ncbi:hypothetical protein CTEN210_17976 [Chaetoceros tenuissimus]|uniref:Uncharacterized protein n=1 Tax=Chaetoceros tenuissimus TaxID=426638 RepID=A0AAD3DDQ1_9STRA|nr:hypothetical protein CTEN210_17976 [Chaetoceros tenuissimus]
MNSQQTFDTLQEIKSFTRQPKRQHLYLRFLGKNGKHLSEDFKQSSLMALLRGLEGYNTFKLHNVEHVLDLQADCTAPWDTIEQEGYTLFIAIDCPTTLLKIQENGNMFVQFQKDENIFKLFEKDIAEQVANLYPIIEVPTSKQQIMWSVVDPDPNSHTLPALSHLEHIQSVLHQELEYSIRPMLDAFHIHGCDIYTKSPILYPYYGKDVSDRMKKNEYTDESVDYTLSTVHVKESLLYGDLKHVVQNVQFDTENEHENVIHLVIYVPNGSQTPSYLTLDGSWSRAFAIPDRNTAFVLVNIPNSKMVYKEFQGENSTHIPSEQDVQEHMEQVYQHEISRAVAYLGTFLRTHYGLSAIQPHRQEYENDSLRIEHEQTLVGVTTWELNAVRRNQFDKMTRDILETLENIVTLVQVRSRLSISQEFAEMYEHCLYHLVHAISLKEDGDDAEATRIINIAMEYMQKLKTDEDTFELPYTAPDQYFAIFGSLLLPLLVPIIKNFMIELKDYKRKAIAKKLSQTIR